MRKKILVIDDDPNIVEYLTELFEDKGYCVVSAGYVAKGLELAKKEMPDLITLDINLPGEWGPRFYRKMKVDKKLRNTPVIVISGLAGNKYAIRKAVASIRKPFDSNRLLKTVKDTIG